MQNDSEKRIQRGETPVETAIERLINSVRAAEETEVVPLLSASGRILAGEIRATIPQPPFTRSPLDGYAVYAGDLKGASRETPIRLPVTQTIPAGGKFPPPLAAGSVARIMTGAPVPQGADAVIRQEDTDDGEEVAAFYTPMNPGENLCLAGEDIGVGDLLIEKGSRLSYAHVGVLAGQGISSVRVYVKPQVAVMSTGDELVGAGELPEPGKLYDSNSAMLAARLIELGMEPVVRPAAPDDLAELVRQVKELLEVYPLVITTGGVSVGKRDYMPLVAETIQSEWLFYGISAKPGSPVMAAKKKESVLLGLSGNPFASLATFELLAFPALMKMSGAESWEMEKVDARLDGCFPKPSAMRRFIRAKWKDGRVQAPEKGHSSGGIGNLAGCNCLIDVPAGSGTLKDGELVKVWLLRGGF